METYSDEELDKFEEELLQGKLPEDEEQVQDSVEEDVVEEEPISHEEPEQIDNSEQEPTEEVDDSQEGNPEDELTQEEEDLLEKYLRENPLEAKSKSARFIIDNRQKLQESINKSLDYHKKTMELAQWRDQIGVIQSGELTKDDLILMAEAKRGNKEAIARMAQMANVDTFELDEDAAENYAPQREYMNAEQMEIQEVAQELLADEVVSPVMQEFSVDMPTDFKEQLSSSPQVLRAFAQDIRDGYAQKIYPQALANQAMYGGNFLEHYQKVGMDLFGQGQNQKPATPAQRPISDRERALRQKAAPPKRAAKQKSFLSDAQSIWDMPEEEFAKISNSDLKQLM
jgi:hypothetical protein